MSDLVLTAPQCAALLECSENHIHDLVRRNAIPHFRLGRSLRFHRPTLDAWIAEQAWRSLEDGSSVLDVLADMSARDMAEREAS